MLRVPQTTPSYATRFAAWEKCIRDLNDDANEAMGTLLSLFHPDCNAHDDLTRWFEEDVSATLSTHDKKRVDFKFRNAWTSSTLYTSLISRSILIPF